MKKLVLPGGVELPISLIRETVREVELFSAQIDGEATARMVEERLRERLSAWVKEGEILSAEVVCGEEMGLFKVSLLAECREEIGKTVDWPS